MINFCFISLNFQLLLKKEENSFILIHYKKKTGKI